MSEVIGSPSLDLKVKYAELFADIQRAKGKVEAEFKDSNNRLAKAHENVMRQMQAQIDRFSGRKATNELHLIAQAVQEMGGVAKLSDAGIKQLTADVERLAAAGAKVPKSLANLPKVGGGAGSTLATNVAGNLAGNAGTLGGVVAGLGPGGLVAAAGIGAVALAATAAGSAVADLAAKAEEWTNTAASTGLGVETVQQLTAMFEDAGVPAETLKVGMKALSAEIASGGKDLEKFGVSIKGWDLMSQEERLRAMAQVISDVEDPATRAAIANAAFGKSGLDMIPVLEGVATGAYKMYDALGGAQLAALSRADAQIDAFTRKADTAKKHMLAWAVELAQGFTMVNGIPVFVPNVDAAAATATKPKGVTAEEKRRQELEADARTAAERKAAAAAAAAEAKKLGDAKAAAVKKEADAKLAVQKLLLDSDKQLIERNRAWWAEQEKLADKVTQRLLADAVLSRGLQSTQINDLGEKVDIVSPAQLEAARRRASSAMGGSGQLVSDIRDQGLPTGFFTRYKDVAEDLGIETDKVTDTLTAAKQAATGAASGFGSVADAMMAMGGVMGKLGTAFAAISGGIGVFKGLGTLKDAKGNAIGGFSFGNLKASMKTTEGKMAAGQAAAAGLGALSNAFGGKNSVAGSALGGAAAGAQMGAIAGPWGMAAGAVIGGAIGFFKGSKLKSEAKEAGKILGKSVSVEQLQAMKEEAKAAGMKWQDYLKKQKKEEERAAKIEARQKLEQGLTAAAQAAESLMARIAEGSVKSSAAIQGLFAAVNDQLIKNGIGILDGRLNQSQQYTGAAGGAADVAGILAGMRQAGVLDSNVSALGGQAAAELQAQARQAALDAGLSAPEADRAGLAAIAPLLREQLNASVQSGKELDEKTKQLLEEAKKNGIEILADPALEQLDVAKEQLDVLKAIEKKKGGAIGAAGGFGPVMTRDLGGGLGPLIQTHPNELAMILPAHLARRGGIISAARGLYEDERDNRGGGGGGGAGTGGGPGDGAGDAGALPGGAVAELRAAVVAAVAQASAPQVTAPITVQVKVDPLMDAQTREAAIAELMDAAADRLAAGTHRLSREIDRKIRESRQAA